MSELFLVLLSYINLSGIDTDTYYKEDISGYPNNINNVVVHNYFYKDEFLYTGELMSLEEWSTVIYRNNFRNSLKEVVKKSLKEKGRLKSGIIPDIELDLKMPKGLRYLIGEGGRISVDGSQSLSLDVSRNQTSSAITERASSFPQIQLEQRLRANIHGTVGQKIHVRINHDSEAREQDNKLKIWYEGDEDDIVQRIDAGNIKELGGGRNQSVFGIKTSGTVGSTRFNLIAGKMESNDVKKSEDYSIASDSMEFYEREFIKNNYYYTGLSDDDSLISLSVFIESDKVNGAPTILNYYNGDTITGNFYFKELEFDNDYELRYLQLSNGSVFPYLRIIKNHTNKRLAIWYIFYNSSLSRVDTLGYIPAQSDGSDTLTLTQFRSKNPIPSDPSWDLQMRNIYSFGKEYPTSVDVTIYKVVPGGDDIEIDPITGKEFVELLGIDADGNGVTDPTQVLWSDGCIIFPDAKPFLNPVLGSDTVPVIYRKADLISDEGKNYRIVIKAVSSKNEFFIGYGDMLDSSEVILVDGVDTLRRGIDYKIDYNTGRVVFTDNANIASDSKISYTYSVEPLFSYTSRYIVKSNIKAHPFKNSDLNLDLAFRSSSNPDQHPKVGMEPSHISLGNVSFSTTREPGFLNTIARNIPFVSNESKSKIKINGKYAFSLPNPASSGRSYLDDMESIKLSRDLELSAGLWNYCSQPDSSFSITDMGKIDWFNMKIPKINIYPELPESQRGQYTSIILLYFQPGGIPNPYNSWAGLMKTFSTYENLSQKKYLEVWVKGNEGELVIDLGSKMKEDIPRWVRGSDGSDSLLDPNGIIDTEDRNGNFELEPGEDTGLDGVAFDDDKWSYIADSLDDGRDDYPDQLKSFQDSLRLHRKENNRRLDTEDLNRDHYLEQDSDFYRYRIDLSSSSLVVNYGLNDWKMYRIPLQDSMYYEKYGDPNFENILYNRIYFYGVDTLTKVRIAKISVVGSKWMNKGIRNFLTDSLNPSGGEFLITYRNSFEDEDYVSPVEQERDIYGGYVKEQSLVFKIDSLSMDNYCLSESYLELPRGSSGKGYDLRLYGSLRFYTKVESNNNDSILVFLRMLTDSSNYYQFSKYINPDNWDTTTVEFQNFYNLKLQGDTVNGNYSLRGQPTIKSISYLHLGVMNPNSNDFNGEVYFDDVILQNANTEMGSNMDISVSSNLGDFITDFSYRIKRVSSNYKASLDALRNIGDREKISHNLNVKTNTGKILNDFMNIPVSFKYERSSEIPKYKKNSDIILPDEKRQEVTTSSESRRIVANISRPTHSDKWWLKYTIDNIRINGSYSQSSSYVPEQKADTVETRTTGLNYSLPLPVISPPILSGGNTSIIPTRLNFNANYEYRVTDKYTYSNTDSIFKKTNVKPQKEINSSGGFTYRPIRWINLSYNISGKNDLLYGDRFGQNVYIHERITANHNSNQFNINNISISYSNSFTQNHGIDYSKTLGDTLDVRSVKQNRTISLSDNIKLNNIFRKVPLLSVLLGNLDPVRINTSFTRKVSFAYLNALPGYRFRYGLGTRPGNEYIVQSNPSDGGTISKQYNISSGLKIFKVRFDISGSYRETKPDELKLQNSVSANKTMTLNFPEAKISINNIDDYLPLLKGILRDSRFEIGIRRDSSTTVNLTGQGNTTGSSSFEISPGLSFKFKNGLDLKVKSNYIVNNKYTTTSYRIHTRSEIKDLSFTGSYSLKPSKEGLPLPLFGKIKWDKPINLKATFTLKNDKEISRNQSTNNEEIRRDNRSINFSISGDYDFSNMVSGGLTFNYRTYLNRKIMNDVTTSYGGKFHILFKF